MPNSGTTVPHLSWVTLTDFAPVNGLGAEPGPDVELEVVVAIDEELWEVCIVKATVAIIITASTATTTTVVPAVALLRDLKSTY